MNSETSMLNNVERFVIENEALMNENTCTCSPENPGQNEQCLVHKKSSYRNIWKEEEYQGDEETSE